MFSQPLSQPLQYVIKTTYQSCHSTSAAFSNAGWECRAKCNAIWSTSNDANALSSAGVYVNTATGFHALILMMTSNDQISRYPICSFYSKLHFAVNMELK